METESGAADVVDRLWRAYAPFKPGRDTSGDLTSMLAILVLAWFVESDDVPWAIAFLKALDRRPTLGQAGPAEVCELFLERHAQENTVSTGEYHTPRAVTRLIVELASLGRETGSLIRRAGPVVCSRPRRGESPNPAGSTGLRSRPTPRTEPIRRWR